MGRASPKCTSSRISLLRGLLKGRKELWDLGRLHSNARILYLKEGVAVLSD